MHHRFDERTGDKTEVDGHKLRAMRLAMGATLAEVARKTGLSVSTIHAIETETRWPEPHAVEQLTKYVGAFTQDTPHGT